MIGTIVTCVVLLEVFYVHPPDKTYWGLTEAQCVVIDRRGPEELDNKVRIRVDCSKEFNTVRLTDHPCNNPIRWMIYGEECF